jgi:hypothetical protein
MIECFRHQSPVGQLDRFVSKLACYQPNLNLFQAAETVQTSPSPPPLTSLRLFPELAPFQKEIESILGPVRLMAPHSDYLVTFLQNF